MLSAAHTVLVSLRPDLHSDIFVEQSDLLFMYVGVNLGLLSMCNYIHPCPKKRCELLITKFSFNPYAKVVLPKLHPGLSYVMSACGININLY